MASAAEIVARVRAKGANVVLDRNVLRLVNGKRLSADARNFVAQHGTEIAAFLDAEGQFEERAAIMEHDGGLPRFAAEGLARVLLANVPDGVDAADWSFFVSKAIVIMDGSAARAA